MPRKVEHVILSDQALELVAARFRILGEANRLKLVRALQPCELSVTQLVEATRLTQANVSRHLQTLTEADRRQMIRWQLTMRS